MGHDDEAGREVYGMYDTSCPNMSDVEWEENGAEGTEGTENRTLC